MSKMIQGVPMYWGAQSIRAERLPPLLKWAGGKEQELRYISPMIPPFRRYYEPFVGGGAVFFSIKAEMKFINDKSTELMNLYRMVAAQNAEFFQTLHGLLYQWQRMSQFVDSFALELLNMYKAYSMVEYPSGKMRELLFGFVLAHPTFRSFNRRDYRFSRRAALRDTKSADERVEGVKRGRAKS